MNPSASALLTDLYQLTMLQTYFVHGMTGSAVFELFVRKLRPHRNFMIAAGLEQVLDFLENLRFQDEDLAWIASSKQFRPDFGEQLRALRFTGDVHALPEGTVFFPDEPVLRVTAPLPQAQLVETRLVNLINFQTMVASKAARSVLAAPGRQVVDFGLRRAHGADAGLLAARAAYLAGFSGTATVLAAPRFGIPVLGTMAHSFIQAHDDEALAFEQFARTFPDNAVLLIDTYDVEAATRKVVALGKRLATDGVSIKGVRIDSGDLGREARRVRHLLDAAGLNDTMIFVSGDLDEYRLRKLLADGAPVDGFGVGTSLVTSSDEPYLDTVYKLQEYAGRPRRKRSTGKETWPGRKQVFRHYGPDGRFDCDVLALEDDPQSGEPLLKPVMRAGRRVTPQPTLQEARERAAQQLAQLPDRLKALEPSATPYHVAIAPSLAAMAEAVDRANERTGVVV